MIIDAVLGRGWELGWYLVPASATQVGPGNLVGIGLVGWVSQNQDAFLPSSNLLTLCKALSCLCSKIMATSTCNRETSDVTKAAETLLMVFQALAVVLR